MTFAGTSSSLIVLPMAVFSPVRHTITSTSSALFSGLHTCSIALQLVTSSLHEHSQFVHNQVC